MHSLLVRDVLLLYYTKVCVRSYSAKVRPYRKSPQTFACICIIFILNAVHNLMQIGRLLFPARQNLCSSFTGLLPVALRFEWTTKQRNLFYLIHVFQLLISGFTLFTCYLCSAEAVSRERV